MFEKSYTRSAFYIVIALFTLSLALVNTSCNDRGNKQNSTSVGKAYKPDSLSFLMKFENSLFPLPSPYLVSHLIKNQNISFYGNLTNKPGNTAQYTTSFKQALNLGVYGTDLSYTNLYEHTPQTIAYLNSIKKLTQELGLGSAFSPSFFESIERNIEHKDSLLVLLGQTYSKADSYLCESDRSEVVALILAGGWTESMYLLSQIAKETSSRELITRLGEQKHPLDNLIEVLTPLYYKSDEYAELIDKFIDLAYEFDGIIYSYSYKEPKIDVENKTTYINSQSRVIISEYHLDIISNKIEKIRQLIVE
ncbi:MAG: hypothetical protein PHD00_00270 [Bacteroidales bacterium]|nr:hypothetical protein [Bacteroidales bacterium]MDD4671697.1 hypothetical protein [Bacteroidales bacterium]